MTTKNNPIIVWGFPDNRPQIDKIQGGKRQPLVCIWRPEQRDSVDMTPRQARLAAAALLRAADAAENPPFSDTVRFERRFT